MLLTYFVFVLSVLNSRFSITFSYMCILYSLLSFTIHVLPCAFYALIDLISLPANSPPNAFMLVFMYVYVDRQTDRDDFRRKHASAIYLQAETVLLCFLPMKRRYAKFGWQ